MFQRHLCHKLKGLSVQAYKVTMKITFLANKSVAIRGITVCERFGDDITLALAHKWATKGQKISKYA